MGRNPGIDTPHDKNHRNSKESLQKSEKAKAHHAAYLGSHSEFTWTSRFNDIATTLPAQLAPPLEIWPVFLGKLCFSKSWYSSACRTVRPLGIGYQVWCFGSFSITSRMKMFVVCTWIYLGHICNHFPNRKTVSILGWFPAKNVCGLVAVWSQQQRLRLALLLHVQLAGIHLARESFLFLASFFCWSCGYGSNMESNWIPQCWSHGSSPIFWCL